MRALRALTTVCPSVALALVASGAPRAQCADPPVPAGGFGVVEGLDELVTYGDGYLTRRDFRTPNASAPACGWPLVAVVHAGGASKAQVATLAASITARGFATVAYDTRGSGPSWLLNDPLVHGESIDGTRELVDLFEQLEDTAAAHPAEVDFTRIGVTGGSEGGRHALWAAAFSGRTPPPNPWRSAPFPVVSAAALSSYAPDNAEMWVPGSATAQSVLIEAAFGGWNLLPADKAAIQGLFLAEDWTGIRDLMHPPAMATPPLLATSAVPWCATFAYDDKYVPPYGLEEALDGAPGVARRVSLSTNYHGSPTNTKESRLAKDLRLRWFARFLRGEANGVDAEPPVRFAVLPVDPADYRDPTWVWDERAHAAWPAHPARRYWLESSGRLTESVPAAAAALDTLAHRSSIDVATYSAVLPNAQGLMASYVPLVATTYTSGVLAGDVHLEGAFRVELEVSCDEPDYQVHAALFDVDPAGVERWVADGFATVRGSVAPGDRTLAFDGTPTSYVFRAGHRVRLALENLVWHRPPTGSAGHVRVLPVFTDFDLDVHRSAARASALDLPVAPLPGPSLAASEVSVSDSAPLDTRFAVQDDTAAAGRLHAIALSLSGTAPGVVVAGVAVPLNPDALTSLCIFGPNVPPLAEFAGALDGTARAEATLAWSALPGLGLAGATVSAVALVLDPATTGVSVSTPARVRVDP